MSFRPRLHRGRGGVWIDRQRVSRESRQTSQRQCPRVNVRGAWSLVGLARRKFNTHALLQILETKSGSQLAAMKEVLVAAVAANEAEAAFERQRVDSRVTRSKCDTAAPRPRVA